MKAGEIPRRVNFKAPKEVNKNFYCPYHPNLRLNVEGECPRCSEGRYRSR